MQMRRMAEAMKPPRTPVMIFCGSQRYSVKGDLGAGAAVTDITIELNRRWMGVSKAGRAPYAVAAEAEKARYEAAMAEAAAVAARKSD